MVRVSRLYYAALSQCFSRCLCGALDPNDLVTVLAQILLDYPWLMIALTMPIVNSTTRREIDFSCNWVE